MHVLAVIPARGGSKGIRNKNIREFCGAPLIARTIDAAKESRYITRIVVSTDAEEIARVAMDCGAEVPFLRPPELAGDSAKVSDAVIHLLMTLKKESGYHPDYIVLLQPTSPLRTGADIDGALELLFKRKAPAVVSVCRTEQLLFTKDAHDRIVLVSDEAFVKSSNRQELDATYKLDGSMVYAVKTDVFLTEKSFIPAGVIGYEIPRWRAIDIDEPQDFVVGELVCKNRAILESHISNFI